MSKPVIARAASAAAAGACIILLCGFLPGGPARPKPPLSPAPALTKVVMGYFPSWNRAAFGHTGIAYQNLTHIANAFAMPQADGGLIIPRGYLYPALNAAAHKNGVKVIMSVGGWGNCEGFPGMAATALNGAIMFAMYWRCCGTSCPMPCAWRFSISA